MMRRAIGFFCCLPVLFATMSVQAQDPPQVRRLNTPRNVQVRKLPAKSLKIVEVGAPAINCVFDSDCRITVKDSSDHFTLKGTTGDAFLQSRTLPPGEPGTAAEGLIGYEYRIDMRNLTGATAAPCINWLRIEFGPVTPIDYNSDGTLDHIFVTTSGGLGSVAPSSATIVGGTITFSFSPPVCSSSTGPGNGDSSYFFGLTSAGEPRPVTAQVRDTTGTNTSLAARAPAPAAPVPPATESHYADSTTVNHGPDWFPTPPNTGEGPENNICVASGASVVSWIQFGFPSFSIPAGRVVTGIEVSVKYRSSDSSPVRLTRDGTLVGSSKSVPDYYVGPSNCTSTGWTSVGGDGELWGSGLTRDDFNAGRVGFRVTQNSGPPITTIDIDAVKLTVYYAAP